MAFLWKLLGLSKEEVKERQRKIDEGAPEPAPFSDTIINVKPFQINTTRKGKLRPDKKTQSSISYIQYENKNTNDII